MALCIVIAFVKYTMRQTHTHSERERERERKRERERALRILKFNLIILSAL